MTIDASSPFIRGNFVDLEEQDSVLKDGELENSGRRFSKDFGYVASLSLIPLKVKSAFGSTHRHSLIDLRVESLTVADR